MCKIIFEDRAVAFIDVLGFSSLVNDASENNVAAMDNLQGLFDVLNSVIPNLNNTLDSNVAPDLIPKHISISDSIILSAKLSNSFVGDYSGLAVVVMRCIQLTHHLLSLGYLLRGGIAVGKVWHSDSNIVGPAYQKAYDIESAVKQPCIVLSERSVKEWKEKKWDDSRMCISKDNITIGDEANSNIMIVNGLHNWYIPENEKYGSIEETYDKYKNIVERNLNKTLCEDPEKDAIAKKKWVWLQEYLESESIN